VDNKTETVYSLSGPFQAGEAFAALDTVGTSSHATELDTLDLTTGALSPPVTGFTGIKGIIWVPGHAQENGGGSEGHGHSHSHTGNHGGHHRADRRH
jgi:hypothetical protein